MFNVLNPPLYILNERAPGRKIVDEKFVHLFSDYAR